MLKISPKAFFFDFDGVICDSEKAHMLSALKVVQEHDIGFSEEYYFEKLFGFDDKGLFEHVFDMHGKQLAPHTLKELMADKNREFLDLVETQIIYFDGVIDLIQRLDAKKIPLAVVSGAMSSEINACLAKGDLNKHFKFKVCADHVRVSKPDSECYEKAFEEMLVYVPDLAKEDCWVLEDSPAGLSAASGAGFNTIAITNSAPASKLRADYVISHYSEIVVE